MHQMTAMLSESAMIYRRFFRLSVLGLLMVAGIAPRLHAQSPTKSATPSLTDVLDVEGRLLPGTEGSFTVSGYVMHYDTDGAPLFLPATNSVDGWDTRFSAPSPNNDLFLLGTIQTLLANENDLYIGGDFGIIRWDGAQYHAIGSEIIGGAVLALAMVDDNLYIGDGFFLSGGNINSIARWDSSQWRSLGTGVTGAVGTLLAVGNDLYVGSAFRDAGGNPNADNIY